MSENIPKKRGPKPKSAFYHARWSKLMISEKTAADVLGVTVDQVKEWDLVGNEMATKYLLLWDRKTVRIPGWEGFCFSRGVLKYMGRIQWTPKGLIQDRFEQMTQSHHAFFNESSIIDTKTTFREVRK